MHLVRWIHGGGDRLPFARLGGHRPLAAAAAGRGRRALRVQARRSGADGGEELVVDPLNPARAGDPFGENSVGAHPRLRAARTGACRAARRPAGSRSSRSRAAPSARRAACGSTCRPATIRRGAYPLVVVHDGDDFVTYADLPVVLDNLIDAGDDPAGDRGAGADPRPARRVLRQPARTRASWCRSCCRRSARAGAIAAAPARAGAARGEPRRGRLARDRLPLSRASSAGWC